MRKLASVQRVLNVRPIEGADLIEAVDVLGWTVVTQKSNNLKVGDLVIYYEVDAFLNAIDPRYASFEERFSNWEGKRGMRLKTIKKSQKASWTPERKAVQRKLNKAAWTPERRKKHSERIKQLRAEGVYDGTASKAPKSPEHRQKISQALKGKPKGESNT